MLYPKTEKGGRAKLIVRELYCRQCDRITEHKCWDFAEFQLEGYICVVFKAVCLGKDSKLTPLSKCNYTTEETLEESDWDALIKNRTWRL